MSSWALELPCRPEDLRASQRARILDAFVQVADERGYAGASVAVVLARAKVSRGAFYELFGSMEEALIAVIDETLDRVTGLATRAFEGERTWEDGLRAALANVLAFLDAEPALARVSIVEVLAAGPVVLARREHNIGSFRALIVKHADLEIGDGAMLSVEGTMASVVGIIHARLVMREPEPLIGLLGPLMGLILSTHLGAAAAQGEVARSERVARAMLAQPTRASRSSPIPPELDVSVPALLRDPVAYRARLCLLYVAEQPGTSNRQIAAGIGVIHQGQASILLNRLVSEGLLVKRSMGVGRRNIWRLTADGERVAEVMRASQ